MGDIPLQEEMKYQRYLITDFQTISKTFTMGQMSAFLLKQNIVLGSTGRTSSQLPESLSL